MTTDINEWCEDTDIETQLENAADLELDAVESPDQFRSSNSSFTNSNGKSKAQELKENISFARLLERDGHTVTGSGTWKKCLCPFHADNNPSFSVNDETNWARCWSCDWKGDIYSYEMDKRTLGFSEALASLEKKEKHICRTRAYKPSKMAAKVVQQALTQEQVQTKQKAAKRLADDFDLCIHVAEKRNWRPETIQKLAKEGVLGWNQGALAFIYDTGMKLRNWPLRDIVWEIPGTGIWRRSRIANASEIIVCEGETDAIALINTGLEDDSKYAVIALPSATTIPKDLADLLKGKHVTLAMDNDQAGKNALYKLDELLSPVCASVSAINYGEVA